MISAVGCGTFQVTGSPPVVRVAACQTLCIDGDLEGNLKRIEYATEQAAAQKSKLTCFPETALLGWVNPQAHKLADSIPGPMYQRVADLARKYKIMISIGLAEKDGKKLYDSVVLIDKDGSLLLKHRKINTIRHLMKPPYTRGKKEDIDAVDTKIGRVGMLICADTFKEDLIKAARAKKPDLLIVPYGWAAQKEEWPGHLESLIKTVTKTARLAGCPVVGTDLVGTITNGPWTGYTYGGGSVVTDRKGKVLAVLRDRDTDFQMVNIPIGRK
ncbi:MAG: carbon-nitrogen hydrolase family protein [Planctomycetota bacterium]|nr:MAG: carbon-nitrogen hydrolase family protein [Planctomycetota bacterium]